MILSVLSSPAEDKITSLFVLLVAPVLRDWGLAWVAPLVVFLEEWLGFLISSMERLPLSVGSDAGPSRRPELDLNQPPAPELSSSSRPESSSDSTSLENHASSEENTEKDYLSPSSQFSSPSTSTATPENQSIESSPNTEQKESLDFLSDELRSFWKTEILRALHDRLDEIDPQGNIGRRRDRGCFEARSPPPDEESYGRYLEGCLGKAMAELRRGRSNLHLS